MFAKEIFQELVFAKLFLSLTRAENNIFEIPTCHEAFGRFTSADFFLERGRAIDEPQFQSSNVLLLRPQLGFCNHVKLYSLKYYCFDLVKNPLFADFFETALWTKS